MSEILQTQQGQDVRDDCSPTGEPSREAGPRHDRRRSSTSRRSSGPPPPRWRRTWPASGRAQTTWRATTTWTARTSTRPAFRRRPSPARARRDAAAPVAFGTRPPWWCPTPPVAGGELGCRTRWPTSRRACPLGATSQSLATGAVSDRISANGKNSCCRSRRDAHAHSRQIAAANAVQAQGGAATRTALTAVEGRSDVSVDPQHEGGRRSTPPSWRPWRPADRRVERQRERRPCGTGVGLARRRRSPPAAERAATPPASRWSGLGPAGPDLVAGESPRCCEGAAGRPSSARAPSGADGSPDVRVVRLPLRVGRDL